MRESLGVCLLIPWSKDDFATNLAGPFFAVYMLRDLKLDYLTYVAIIATATMANLIFITFWAAAGTPLGRKAVDMIEYVSRR